MVVEYKSMAGKGSNPSQEGSSSSKISEGLCRSLCNKRRNARGEESSFTPQIFKCCLPLTRKPCRGVLFLGAFAAPLVPIFEMNSPRNVSLVMVGKLFVIGGVTGLCTAMFAPA